MAKGRSKKAGKAKSQAGATDLKGGAVAGKTPRGLRKQLRRLEGQLVEAARVESKRLRKLERARNRRQVAEAALAFVLSETAAQRVKPKVDKSKGQKSEPAKPTAVKAAAAPAATAAKPAAKPAVSATAKPRSTGTAAAKPAARPRTTRTAAAKPAARPRRAPAKPATPAPATAPAHNPADQA
jgi:hypothetical protein